MFITFIIFIYRYLESSRLNGSIPPEIGKLSQLEKL